MICDLAVLLFCVVLAKHSTNLGHETSICLKYFQMEKFLGLVAGTPDFLGEGTASDAECISGSVQVKKNVLI